MKKIITGLLPLVLPLCLCAQFMKDYQPTGSPLVTSTVNLVSVVEGTASAAKSSRSVNSIQESATVGFNDVWVNAVDSLGNVTLSRRYGLPNVEEFAAALVRCPNGDFIYAATTTSGGIRSAWLFRRGLINWSFRYFLGTSNVTAYCIKKTNETGFENYIVAATIDSDRNLLVFKVNGNGILQWNQRYTDPVPPPALSDIPKSMIIKGDTVLIAGNRSVTTTTGAVLRDIFVIGVNQANGAILVPYRFIDNAGLVDINPFINFGIGGEYVLTYQTNLTVGTVNTGRIAFSRLNAVYNLAVPSSVLYWENNAVNSFGHTIYRSVVTGGGYDIGGGTTIANLNNPLIFTITPTGAVLGGTYRRLWTTLSFNSTYMMQDAFVATNRYEHHNYKRAANQNSMSLLRNNTLPSPCNVAPALVSTSVTATLTPRTYTLSPVITQTIYPIPDSPVHGIIPACNSTIVGVFKTVNAAAADEQVGETVSGFRAYPTILNSGANLRVEWLADNSAPAQISLFTLQAQRVYNRTETGTPGMQRHTIGTAGLRPGTYVVEVEQGKQKMHTKIIIQ